VTRSPPWHTRLITFTLVLLSRSLQIFYTHAVAAVIVYDVTSRETFDSVIKWKQDIDAKVFLPSGAKIPVLLLGNKSDLLGGESGVQSCVSPDDLKRFVEQHGFYAQSVESERASDSARI
jgi:GTPase SAR1 family protein